MFYMLECNLFLHVHGNGRGDMTFCFEHLILLVHLCLTVQHLLYKL